MKEDEASGHPLASVIILNWNGKHLLGPCLSSLERQTYPNIQIIVVDNGSTDGSVEFVREKYPNIDLARNETNLGFCKGNNIGFEHAEGKYFIALNNDTVVAENFVEEMVKLAESDDSVGSVGCKIIQTDGSILYGPAFTFLGFLQPLASTKTVDRVCLNLANCACASLYRRDMISEIGAFDPWLWSDYEDHDLGFRANVAGYSSVHTPLTHVLHVGGASVPGKINAQRFQRMIRNSIYVHFKNYETKNLLFRLPVLAIFTLLKGIVFAYVNESAMLIKRIRPSWVGPRNIGHSRMRCWYFPFFKGYVSFLSGLPSAWANRSKVQCIRKVSDDYVFERTRERDAGFLERLMRIGQ